MRRTFGATTCLLMVFALLLVGCKSKETTSAMLHNQTGRHDLAIETAQEAIAKDPNDAEAYFQLGLAYANLDSVTLAYNSFMKSVEIDPKRKDLAEDNIQSLFAKHYNKALSFSKNQSATMEDLEAAAAEFELAAESDPRQSKGFYQLGKTYTRMGDEDPKYYEKALPPLDKVLELSSPSDVHYIDALSLAGQVLAKTGDPEAAVSRFSRLVEEDPTNYPVIEDIGMDLLTEEKDYKGATIFLDLAAQARSKIGAEDFNLYYNLGVAHFQLGKQENDADEMATAVSYYEKALLLQPDEPTTTYNIVVAYFVGEKWDQAAIWGEKYVTIQPQDKKGWSLLSRSYSELGDQEKARQAMSRYEQLAQ